MPTWLYYQSDVYDLFKKVVTGESISFNKV